MLLCTTLLQSVPIVVGSKSKALPRYHFFACNLINGRCQRQKGGRLGIVSARIFADRHAAGIELGKLLAPRFKDVNALVLGIPRGGVIVAYEIARLLDGELSVVITKKLPHPMQEEFAIGAAAEDGSTYLNTYARGIADRTIREIVSTQLREIKSRVIRFRNGNPLPDMQGRVVIIADDGIATGSTVVPALKLCKNRKAARIIVAAPVSGHRFTREIHKLADEIVIAEQPEEFTAVGQAYDDFHHLRDEEVTGLLDEFVRHQH